MELVGTVLQWAAAFWLGGGLTLIAIDWLRDVVRGIAGNRVRQVMSGPAALREELGWCLTLILRGPWWLWRPAPSRGKRP